MKNLGEKENKKKNIDNLDNVLNNKYNRENGR